MSKLIVSALIGVVAGVIDVLPMIIQKIDKYACASAFVQWVVLGIIISYVQMPIPSFIKGIVVAVLASLPILILVSKDDIKSILPILIMSIILGAGVGVATSRFSN